MSLTQISHLKNMEGKTFKGHSGKVQSLAWNMDGTILASGSVDTTAMLWTAHDQDLRPSTQLRGHTEAIQALCWNPTHPNYVATASTDRSVRIWDTRQRSENSTGDCVATSGENINIAWSPDGRHIAVGNDEDCVTIIDSRKLQVLTQKKYSFQVNEFGWNPSSSHFFMTAFGADAANKSTGTFEILNFEEDGKLCHQHTVPCHTAACYCIDFDPTGKLVCVGSADANVSVWTLEDLVCVATVERHENPIRALSFNHDGTLIASGSEHKFIDVASSTSGECKYKITTQSLTNALRWHPHSNVLAYADDSSGNVHICASSS